MSPQKASILIVDDELSVRDSLLHWFRKDGLNVSTAANATLALQALEQGSYDIVLLDIKMPGMDGMELQRTHPHARAQDHRHHDDRVRLGGHRRARSQARRLRLRHQAHRSRRALPPGRAAPSKNAACEDENSQLRETIAELSSARLRHRRKPGHAQGDGADPPGGADQRHRHDPRRKRHRQGAGGAHHPRQQYARKFFPIVPINCGALPDSLLESELFGHEKGAFTGANFRRKGRLEMADGGTLFLDEIGTITPKMQVDLLRTIETGEVMRLGGLRPVEGRTSASSARPTKTWRSMVADGRFRQDLYYRINVFSIALPPLRERLEDIATLARHFLKRLALQMDKRVFPTSAPKPSRR